MSTKTYLGLAAGALIALAAAWLFREEGWLSGVGLNLGTEILGILITLLFVERILKVQQEESRRRVARGALRKTGQSLQRIVKAFANLLKGSLDAMPSTPPKSVSELLSDQMTDNLSRCDLGSVHAVPLARNWAEYMNSVLYSTLADISAAIDMYSAFLPAEYVELLDELHDHPYVVYVRSMYPYIESERTRHPDKEFPLDGRPQERKDFFRTLVRAVEHHNRIAQRAVDVPVSFALENYAPDVGGLRIAAACPKLEHAAEPIPAFEGGGLGRPTPPAPPRIKLLDP